MENVGFVLHLKLLGAHIDVGWGDMIVSLLLNAWDGTSFVSQ